MTATIFSAFPGRFRGRSNFWGIYDRGTDNLGRGRPSVLPEPDVNYRYRFVEQHRQELGEGFTFTAEVGKISDRNFLLEYFKQDWDEQKDPTTDLDLTFRRENMSMSLLAEARLDNFVTETHWLPRFDHYLLGQSLLADQLTWFEHTSVGYAQFKVGTLPSAAAGDEAVSHLPWEPRNFSGGRFVTRNEIDLPLELGPVKVVPYVLGELGYWGEDLNGQPLTRAYYQAGIRATLPMWAVDSEAESTLWNVHGLAHKVEFQAEYLHAQSNQSMTRPAALRSAGRPADRRFPPPLRGQHVRLSGRSAAVDAGAADEVRRAVLRLADRHGRLGHRAEHGNRRQPGRSSAWASTSAGRRSAARPTTRTSSTGSNSTPTSRSSPMPTATTSAPTLGLSDYNFIWHVGDRLTLLSDGIFDFFDQGQKIVTTGMFLTRPPRGALYMGFRVLEGPISSEVLTMSYSYWMSPKWITTSGMSIDLKNRRTSARRSSWSAWANRC